MVRDVFDYPRWMRDALRQVARRALAEVAEGGFFGAHHFYLSFHTDHPGVEIPDFLRERYPEEMTIVIQHQFWDLEVDDEGFSVGLSFGSRPEHVRVPFAALTTFLDPAAEFGLRFDLAEEADDEAADRETGPIAVPDPETVHDMKGAALDAGAASDEDEPDPAGAASAEDAGDDEEDETAEGGDGGDASGRVVSIDHFRKK